MPGEDDAVPAVQAKPTVVVKKKRKKKPGVKKEGRKSRNSNGDEPKKVVNRGKRHC
jgi:hypothetical protein